MIFLPCSHTQKGNALLGNHLLASNAPLMSWLTQCSCIPSHFHLSSISCPTLSHHHMWHQLPCDVTSLIQQRHAFQSLVGRIEHLLMNSSSQSDSSLGINQKALHSNSTLLHCLDQSQYPNIQYWTKKDFTNSAAYKKNSTDINEPTPLKGKQNPAGHNNRERYAEYENGDIVDGF